MGSLGGTWVLKKTYLKIRQRFYWPHMHDDIRDWCRDCMICAQRKPYNKPKHPMGTVPVKDKLDRVAIDILDVTTVSNKGNRYILVIADYFTKWTEAYALPNHTAVTVAETLITEFVCRWGMPLAIHDLDRSELLAAYPTDTQIL